MKMAICRNGAWLPGIMLGVRRQSPAWAQPQVQ